MFRSQAPNAGHFFIVDNIIDLNVKMLGCPACRSQRPLNVWLNDHRVTVSRTPVSVCVCRADGGGGVNELLACCVI